MTDDLANRLLCVLRTQTGASALEYCNPPERLTGGFWAELLGFELREPPSGWEGPLVARVMPDPGVARKETVIQATVAVAGVPTPRVRGAGGPEDGLGRAYMVMDRVEGVPLLAGLDSAAGLFRAPSRLWRMPDLLARTMASLHTVDPGPVREELSDVNGTPRTIPDMLDYLQSQTDAMGRNDLVAATRWLISHPVPAGDEVICHGDLHPFNVLVDDKGRMTVLDWSAALLAPRGYDVAFTSLILSTPPIAVPAPFDPLVRSAGRGLARRFLTRYRQQSGQTIERTVLEWFQAVVCLRALAEAAKWVHEDVVETHAGHPWLLSGRRFAAHLGAVTGVPVRSL